MQIDNYLPDDLTIAAVVEDSDTLERGNAYDYRSPYMNTVVDIDEITNVTTRGRKAQVDNDCAREALPDAYAQEPLPLTTQR